MDTLFSNDDHERIAAAIEAAEAGTSGEIAPYVVPRSDPYEAVPWRGGVLGALMAAAFVVLARSVAFAPFGWLTTDAAALLLTFGAGGLGALTSAIVPPLVRLFAGADRMDDAVHRRAMKAFVDEEVFATQDRTGILLFVSLLERRIEVVADAGIYQAVDDDTWSEVTARIRDGIESGQLVQGLIDGIERCGAILDAHGLDAGPDAPDELPSHLRVSDE